MPRPKKPRRCRRFAAERVYKPQGIPMREIEYEFISLDQYEALRLCDLENFDQEVAGLKMGVSRGTIQRLLYSGRRTIVEAFLNNNAIIINPMESETEDVSVHSHHRRHRSKRRNQ